MNRDLNLCFAPSELGKTHEASRSIYAAANLKARVPAGCSLSSAR